MNIYWITVLREIGGTIGQVLLSIAATLLAGRTFKELLLWPLRWLAGKTKSKLDDKLVEDAEKDLGLRNDTDTRPPQ